MNRVLYLLIPVVILVIFSFTGNSQQASSAATASIHYIVNNDVIQAKPDRLGINLGSWSTWGAEQFMRNILQNPGFEGRVNRWVVITASSGQNQFSDLSNRGMEDNYWKDAQFEIRSGKHAGTKGKVIKSLAKGENGNPQFFTKSALPKLDEKTIIVLSKDDNKDPVPVWWIDDKTKPYIHVDKTTKRPNSQGEQSLRFDPNGSGETNDIYFYLDTIGQRAGKLLPVKGKWRLSFWAKSEKESGTITALFKRLNGSQGYLEEMIRPTKEWKRYTFEFNPKDLGPADNLQFGLKVKSNAPVWIDDVYLGEIQEGQSPFRQEVIQALKLLRPSYLRDSGALGDSFANSMASMYKRKVFVYHRSGGSDDTFSYSIPDMISLAKAVGAKPWIILPITWSDEEYYKFGQYLAKTRQANQFEDIIVEFGNENWNWIFRPLGIPFQEQHGEVAERAFKKIMEGSGNDEKILKFINGQHVNPWLTMQYLSYTPTADGIAIAPYYFGTADSKETPKEALKNLFASDKGDSAKTSEEVHNQGKKVAVYELNSHNTEGDMAVITRNGLVAGMVSGAALAQNAIKHMLLGYNPVVISNLSQFDIHLGQVDGYINIWGIMRDVLATGRFRPTGIAMLMLNRVIEGEMHGLTQEGSENSELAEYLTLAAFKSEKGWRAAVSSSSPNPIQVSITFPDDGIILPTNFSYMYATTITATNEKGHDVIVKTDKAMMEGRTLTFTVPPYDLVVLTP